jgi:hypothetical protein
MVFDTNIVLDVLLIREPYAQMSMNLFDAVVCAYEFVNLPVIN